MMEEQRHEVVSVNQLPQGFIGIDVRALNRPPIREKILKSEMAREIAEGARVGAEMMTKIMPGMLGFNSRDFLKGRLVVSLPYYKTIGGPTVGDVLVISMKKEEVPSINPVERETIEGS